MSNYQCVTLTWKFKHRPNKQGKNHGHISLIDDYSGALWRGQGKVPCPGQVLVLAHTDLPYLCHHTNGPISLFLYSSLQKITATKYSRYWFCDWHLLWPLQPDQAVLSIPQYFQESLAATFITQCFFLWCSCKQSNCLQEKWKKKPNEHEKLIHMIAS